MIPARCKPNGLVLDHGRPCCSRGEHHNFGRKAVLIDVDNLIDYMMITFFDGDRDGPVSDFMGNNAPNNWYGIRNRDGEEGFRFFVHDAEHTLSRGNTDRTGPYPAPTRFPIPTSIRIRPSSATSATASRGRETLSYRAITVTMGASTR